MQWILLVMLVSSNGHMEYHDPMVFYGKKACRDAQSAVAEMAPDNATVTVITKCVIRGNNKE